MICIFMYPWQNLLRNLQNSGEEYKALLSHANFVLAYQTFFGASIGEVRFLMEVFACRTYRVSDFGRTLKRLAGNFKKIKRCVLMWAFWIWNQIVKVIQSCEEIYVQTHVKITLFSIQFLNIRHLRTWICVWILAHTSKHIMWVHCKTLLCS